MSETKHESDVRVLSGFVRGQRNFVGDHWTPSMACEALDRVLAALAASRAAREAMAEKAVELAVKYSDAVDRAIAAEAQLSALRSRCKGLADYWHADYSTFTRNEAADELRRYCVGLSGTGAAGRQRAEQVGVLPAGVAGSNS